MTTRFQWGAAMTDFVAEYFVTLVVAGFALFAIVLMAVSIWDNLPRAK